MALNTATKSDLRFLNQYFVLRLNDKFLGKSQAEKKKVSWRINPLRIPLKHHTELRQLRHNWHRLQENLHQL